MFAWGARGIPAAVLGLSLPWYVITAAVLFPYACPFPGRSGIKAGIRKALREHGVGAADLTP